MDIIKLILFYILSFLEVLISIYFREPQETLEPQESRDHLVMMENPVRMDRKERKEPLGQLWVQTFQVIIVKDIFQVCFIYNPGTSRSRWTTRASGR